MPSLKIVCVAVLLRDNWQTANPIREIFKQAFKNADLPYYNPHSFRNTLVTLALTLCKTPEQFKMWSQNLGHESVLITFYSYGEVPDYRQAELLKKLREPKSEQSPEVLVGSSLLLRAKGTMVLMLKY